MAKPDEKAKERQHVKNEMHGPLVKDLETTDGDIPDKNGMNAVSKVVMNNKTTSVASNLTARFSEICARLPDLEAWTSDQDARNLYHNAGMSDLEAWTSDEDARIAARGATISEMKTIVSVMVADKDP